MNSLTYFAQPRYWRADYGYRGDCEAKEPILVLRKDENQGLSADDVLRKVKQ